MFKNEVKIIKSLKHKKFRQRHDLFVAEGTKIIQTILKSSTYKVRSIYFTKRSGFYPITGLENKQILIDERTMKSISFLNTPSSALALVEIPKNSKKTIERAIYLDGVQDPGNVGTIIRIADWFGLDAVIRSEDAADFYNPKVVQSTMGAFANLQLLEMSQSELIELKKITLFAADMNGISIENVGKQNKFILIVGSEGSGLSENLKAVSIQKIAIKGSGSRVSESLNVSVAVGVICAGLVFPEAKRHQKPDC